MSSGQDIMDSNAMDCRSFFDDFLDVTNDDTAGTYSRLSSSTSLQPILHPDTFLPGSWSSSLFPCPPDSFFSNSDISAELSVPYDDIVQLEWLSSFGGGGGLTVCNPRTESPGKQLPDSWFRTSSPVSVLDTTSSCSAEKSGAVTVGPSRCGRARSKRARPKAVIFRPMMVPPLPTPLGSSAESSLMIMIPKGSNPEYGKRTKSKEIGDEPSQAMRKCIHCEITKTPQWRAGPMGPKTLCNACGVRYKSGRLFPEYRPAASPAFLPSLHSNSHKRVLEMRNNVVVGRATEHA
ncbi:hypothetical protein MLD38_038085 [Melastoma candidum]|uniref:Uncharacterized protein n=1 Tax=Melastoma candidum TaxID=119954 RepID=A0ACB9KY40_9MYRT|nr:hypothetical protein MLD38_038085 [Melastoma candidum]